MFDIQPHTLFGGKPCATMCIFIIWDHKVINETTSLSEADRVHSFIT